ncbi:ASST-domain-containing protein [Talaromyces proteolyticus]|uniref:ASST-domain-containing protein n=1 Tax=Talaromyces proteolyticus TaxID=1131652 RepID=A0AAD4KU36_9EURO|nr:ASST-domain-containing protein [Talaromyces proteolyticus]KAH8700903.1 ASST-domain-containing protein [Talaromyces proteolyticus]
MAFYLWLLGVVWTSFAQADVEPYYASADYDKGEFGPWPLQSYKSSSLVGPVVNYLFRAEECNKDGKYTFITPRGYSVPQAGPLILDKHGSLVWTKGYGPSYDFNVQRYKGENYLTFWVGNDDLVGHGSGSYYMLDSSYKEAYKVSGANGKAADLHEFRIIHENTAVLTLYNVLPANLSSMGGPENGYIWDSGFQELNIETGEAIFEWWASAYFGYDEAYRGIEGEGEEKNTAWDYFHINSVDKDQDGNYLISSRYMNCLTYINGTSGDIIWKLGGKHNMFVDLSGGAATNISWQHDARFQKNDTAITLFDNASRGSDGFSVGDGTSEEYSSRGLYLDIDKTNLTVKVRYTYWNPRGITSISQGSVQLLEDDRVIVGYGINAAWTEYTLDGQVLCDVHFGPESGFGTKDIVSYRASRHAWVGKPKTLPDIAVHDHKIYVSWNGATEVADWVLEGAKTKMSTAEYHVIVSQPKDGFETVILVPENPSYRFIRARGLDRSGYFLGHTKVMAENGPLEMKIGLYGATIIIQTVDTSDLS